jgi:hypothetical protein
MAALGVAAPSYAQSASASDTAAVAAGRRDGTSGGKEAFGAPGPFTYNAVGATPSIRLTARTAANATQRTPGPAADRGVKHKTPGSQASKAPPLAVSQ